MRKTFQYRLFPTKKQIRALQDTLEECRWLYNHLLEKRHEAWEHEGQSLSLYQQQATFALLKGERPSLKRVHSQVLQNVAVRIDLAMKAFFRRCKAGEKPGYPCFRGKDRYDSFTFPQSGFSIFRREEHALAKVQRKHAKLAKGSAERRTHRKAVARVHERIGWKRENFTHQASRKIVNQFGIICVEDLSVNRMLHNHCLAKSIADASWSAFFVQLSAKAEEAGRQLVKVNPAYTSQTCSQCGHRQKMPLSERMFDCPCCLAHLDRDLNAALNILRLGLQSCAIPEAPALHMRGSSHTTVCCIAMQEMSKGNADGEEARSQLYAGSRVSCIYCARSRPSR